MSDHRLMKIVNFDEPELNANRSGRLSEKQKRRLTAGEKSQKGCSAILGIFLFVVASIGIFALHFGWTDSSQEENRIGLTAFGCIWLLVCGTFGYFILRRSFAKFEVKVRKAEGPVRLVKAVGEIYNSSSKASSEYSVYELRVGRKIFEVDADLVDVVEEGDIYAVYYADVNLSDIEDAILSMELLEKQQR